MTNPDQSVAGTSAWRSAKRQALIQQRMALDKETLSRWQLAMDRHLEAWFQRIRPASAGVGSVIGVYWPHRNEYDIRALAACWRTAGAVIALPVIASKAAPLEFHAWDENAPLREGPYGIFEPVRAQPLQPAMLVLPAVAFDDAGYRLGYGGGYFDRTLAALTAQGRPPITVATAFEFARLDDLHPLPHDLPMDWVVSEVGVYERVGGKLRPMP